MVEAALRKSEFCNNANTRRWMRAAIEAALGAWVKPTRAESARARWDAVTPEQRKQYTAPALKGRLAAAKATARAAIAKAKGETPCG
jgi:hypothetical protein